MIQRLGDLELDQDLEFQERQWTVQRIGWFVMLLVIGLALVGLFGTGPLASAEAGSDAAGLSVDYQRIVRRQGESALTIGIAPDQVTNGQVELWIDADYLGNLEIKGISPEPEAVRASGDRQVFVFDAEPDGSPLHISINFETNTMGRLEPQMGVNDSEGISFTQVSLP